MSIPQVSAWGIWSFMEIYFAPMEGLTDSVYRALHHKYFGGVDKYYMPFLSPTAHRALTPREARELPEADTVGFEAVPQFLTKSVEDFLWAAEQCRDRGYREVNLNLGCPSGTVFSKGKGSGMLRDPEGLDRFLEGVFSASPLPISLKSRLGVESAEELPRLLDIYNRYPVKLLILHPRVRKSFYDGPVDMEAFEYALEHSKHTVCFNGNLCSREDLQDFSQKYPSVTSAMLGRGLIGNPGMFTPNGTTPEALEAFSDELLDTYTALFGGSRNAMFRLKENWRYLLCLFEETEKLGKRLRKTTDVAEYRSLTHEVIRNCPMRENLAPDW